MSPGYKGVASIAPPTLRAWKHRITSMKIGSSDIHLPERLRRQLEDLLRPDIQRLRIYMGEGFDGWGIA
jgi:hypothetical protein